jgi:hypothetical protein
MAPEAWRTLKSRHPDLLGFVLVLALVSACVPFSLWLIRTWPGALSYILAIIFGVNSVIGALLYVASKLSKSVSRRVFLVSLLLTTTWVVTQGWNETYMKITTAELDRAHPAEQVAGHVIALGFVELIAWFAAGLLLLGAHWYSRGPRAQSWPALGDEDDREP